MMKVTKFKVLLYLKKSSTDKRGKAPIMGRITLNNSIAQFSCKISCTVELWNPRSGRMEGKSSEAVDINAKIDKLLLNINSAYDNLLKRNVDFIAQSIKELMQGSVDCQVTLMDMMDRLYADMEKRIGIDRAEGSLVHYKQARAIIGKFIEAKFKTKDIAFGQLTNRFISDYYEFLVTDCGFVSNSTRKYLAILKKACRVAYKEGYTDRLFFANYPLPKIQVRAIQIHIHRDEGHYENPEDKSTWQPNFHAHIIWDWMDHDTGKSFKLNAEDMSAIQDLVAETLDMQRGQKKSETGIDHLERNDFIIQKQESKKKQLQEEAKKAVAEKEEAEAEVEAAKTEVADLWKEHDYLTNSNRTKVERSNRLDFDIKTKQERSQSLDDTIEAKSKEVSKLAAKADEKLQDFYTIKERGDWQDPMFFGMSAYIYRFDEGLQFFALQSGIAERCIKAIQDFAYSGFGGRGGKHGDFFWDNE